MTDSNKRVKITVLLDDETLKKLRDYGYEKFGITNVSKSIMSMVADYDRSRKGEI